MDVIHHNQDVVDPSVPRTSGNSTTGQTYKVHKFKTMNDIKEHLDHEQITVFLKGRFEREL